MKNLELWLRPAVLLSLWIAAVAFTLAELGKVGPLLASVDAQAAAARRPARPSPGARAQPPRLRVVAR